MLSKSVFGYFKTKKKIQQKKVPMATKLEGGKALVAQPLVEELFFCGFPNRVLFNTNRNSFLDTSCKRSIIHNILMIRELDGKREQDVVVCDLETNSSIKMEVQSKLFITPTKNVPFILKLKHRKL